MNDDLLHLTVEEDRITMSVIIKRRYAVMLEDAIEVPAPSAEELAEVGGDLTAWAEEHYAGLYEAAHAQPPGTGHLPKVLWEDEFRFDLDIDDEYEVSKS